jgi:hypothetical protein
LAATFDGVNLQGLQKYRVRSSLFSMTVPSSNIYGISFNSQAELQEHNNQEHVGTV